ncbi:MAG: hypothetical protein LBH84_01700, partial [Prevotellaceae bacterium]|nr:hypothetical protein [Prevotellaceae bacterium]
MEITYFFTGGQLQYSFTNAESAQNLGVEIELRKKLDFMGMKKFSLVCKCGVDTKPDTFREKPPGKRQGNAGTVALCGKCRSFLSKREN